MAAQRYTKVPKRRKRGRGKARENGREEQREEIAQFPDAQITMQRPTDKETERRRRRMKQQKKREGDGG